MSGQDSNVASMSKSEVKRRNLVKGAAWTVPVVAVAAAAPMAAASPIPPTGLNGWISQSRSCSRTRWLIQDGRGNFTGGGPNDRGIWTFVADPNAVITYAQLIVYHNYSNISYQNNSEAGWSNLDRNPALDSTAPAGFYAYEATYTGTWVYSAQYGAWYATGDPYWTGLRTGTSNGCVAVSTYGRRTITVNGNTVTFIRGPITT